MYSSLSISRYCLIFSSLSSSKLSYTSSSRSPDNSSTLSDTISVTVISLSYPSSYIVISDSLSVPYTISSNSSSESYTFSICLSSGLPSTPSCSGFFKALSSTTPFGEFGKGLSYYYELYLTSIFRDALELAMLLCSSKCSSAISKSIHEPWISPQSFPNLSPSLTYSNPPLHHGTHLVSYHHHPIHGEPLLGSHSPHSLSYLLPWT